MNKNKTPPAHNKFTICSIFPPAPRARAQLPWPPPPKMDVSAGRQKVQLFPPGTSCTLAGTNFAYQKDLFLGGGAQRVVWVLQFGRGEKSKRGHTGGGELPDGTKRFASERKNGGFFSKFGISAPTYYTSVLKGFHPTAQRASHRRGKMDFFPNLGSLLLPVLKGFRLLREMPAQMPKANPQPRWEGTTTPPRQRLLQS